MAEKRMLVEVRGLKPEDQLAKEDRKVVGTFGLTLVDELCGLQDSREAALDIFHLVVPISMLENFDIEARESSKEVPDTDLGRFSMMPNSPFVNRLMEDAFGPALRAARPGIPEDALVYAVDAGNPGDPNTEIRAAVFDRGILDRARMIGEPITVTVSKEWLAEFAVQPEARNGPGSW